MIDQLPALAGRWQRFVAAMIDGIISIVIFIPIFMLTGVMKQLSAGVQLSPMQKIVFFILGMLVYLALHGVLLMKHGQTIGKRMVNIRIVDLDGQILPLSKLFLLRVLPISIATQLPMIGGLISLADLLFIFGNERRSLHDRLAGTVVIQTN